MLSQKTNDQIYDLKKLIYIKPELSEFVSEDFQRIDLNTSKAVRLLNQALVLDKLKIAYWDFPKDNLVPPYPSRLEYLKLLKDSNPESINKVLDIGTGATLIYPIIGAKLFKWNFVGVDTDQDSLDSAQNIIDQNKLNNHIQLRLQKKPYAVLNNIILPQDQFDLVICNPPFYESMEDASKSFEKKSKFTGENTLFKGTKNELVYEKGGELGFLKTYIRESKFYGLQCNYFSSLVSKKEFLRPLKVLIKKQGATATQTKLSTKNKTHYILTWTYSVKSKK